MTVQRDAPKGPILIDLADETPVEGPDLAPPVPEVGQATQTGLQVAARWAGRKPSRLGRWIFGLLLAFVGSLAGLAAWDAVISLITRVPVLGYGVAVIGVALILAVLMAVVGELAALARLGRVEALQRGADTALAEADLSKARQVSKALLRLYARRQDLDWARSRFEERQGEQLDADALLALAERELMAPLDHLAEAEVHAAARQVATVTALVPLTLADVLTALTANLRMIRRIAEIYGGRSGTLGSWRLFSAVMAHLVATGAVAIGDDFLGSLAGGGLVSKLSRRFGEGVINGALTVRVGVAAMEVCRPLPFQQIKRPSVGALVGTALGGLFTSKPKPTPDDGGGT